MAKRRARTDSRDYFSTEERPRKRRRRRGANPALSLLVALALLAAGFGAGWYFGVKSTQFHGEILLVNDSHRLAADYVPEGLVNLYQQRHSFRLANSEIYLTRETYEAMERMFHAAEEADVNGFIITSG